MSIKTRFIELASVEVAVIVFLIASPAIVSPLELLYVDLRTGNDNVSCSEGTTPCKTFEYASSYLKNDSQIIIMPGLQVLNDTVELQFLSNITISGEYGSSMINCSSTNAGIKFTEVRAINIFGVEFRHCGMLQESTSVSSHNQSFTVLMHTALYFLNSTDVNIMDCIINGTNGRGITMFDTGGTVTIQNVTFNSNEMKASDEKGGGGLYIELTRCTPGRVNNCDPTNHLARNNNYAILNCTFKNNIASNVNNSATTFMLNQGPSWQRFGFGGGTLIALKGSAYNNSVTFVNCSFVNNKAIIGGGIAFIFDDDSNMNSFNLIDSELHDNYARSGGGGVEFGFFGIDGTKNTSVMFSRSKFIGNKATYGGGVSFFASRMQYTVKSDNLVAFSSCVWRKNIAKVGAAVVFFPENWVSLSSGYLPVPRFRNCYFVENNIRQLLSKERAGSDSVDGAIIYSNTFSLIFNRKNTFKRNKGSPIHIAVGDIIVQENSTLEFISNLARKGGAISLVGYSGLVAHSGATVRFINNTAQESGGAVYYSSYDYMDVINSRRCFLTYSEVIPVDDWKAEFIFDNNKAMSGYGNAIYATYLEACARASISNVTKKPVIKEVFRWKPFTFLPAIESNAHTVTSDPAQLLLDYETLQVVPGAITNMNFTVKDGLDQPLNVVLYASSQTMNEKEPSTYTYISGNKMKIEGMQNEQLMIKAETISSRLLDITLYVDTTYCPPGYYYNGKSCHCSVSTVHQLPGIVACNDSNTRAKMLLGYWAGYVNDSNGDPLMATGQCPLGYCEYEHETDGLMMLPNNFSMLSDVLCTPKNREGILCGKCLDGFSVYYHSVRYDCGECKYADYGIPLYIASELLPLTVLFLVVIIFDISFTSGPIMSFILFAQILDFFNTTAFGVYYVPSWMSSLVQVYLFIFGFFNLEFFKLDALSFCLWKEANVLHVLAFKYVTTLYGLLLIVLLFVIMHFCSCNILRRCRRNKYGGYTVTNGLTAFVIITYSQCAKVSFEILTRYRISTDRHTDHELDYHSDVVFLAGEIPFFGSEHLKYAPFALFSLLYVIIIPLCLILQPLVLLFNALLVGRGMEIQGPMCCKKLNLKLKPILDSFQHSYKDNIKVFIGFLFLYRLLIAASFAFSVTASAMYGLLELTVVIMLTIHSILQPYTNNLYNIIDSLMYADLAIINGISLYSVIAGPEGHIKVVMAVIQLLLIYLPILYFFGYVIFKMYNYFTVLKSLPHCCLKDDDHEVDFSRENLPDRLFDDDDDQDNDEDDIETNIVARKPRPRRLDQYGSIQRGERRTL